MVAMHGTTTKALHLLGRPTATLAVRAQAGTPAAGHVVALLSVLVLRALLVRAEAVVREEPFQITLIII
jgi:hypothetical protein